MGLSTSNLFTRLFGKKQMRILMSNNIHRNVQLLFYISNVTFFIVGLDDAGKTTILYKLKGEGTTILPTVGFNIEQLEHKNIVFTVWDIGWRSTLWRHYFANTQGLIFVIDSFDRERLLEARDKLQEMVLLRNRIYMLTII